MSHFAPPKVVPPFRFATVEVGLYRGAYPTLKNFPFLEMRQLRTIISLIPEKPTQDLQDFCEFNSIELLPYVVERRKDDVPLSIKEVAEILAVVIKPEKLPLYIHCLDGADVTSIVISCLRRLQAWHSECIANEFSRYARSSEMTSAELKFVNSMKEFEICDSHSLPKWLWKGNLPSKPGHPFVKLIHRSKGRVVQVLNPRRNDELASASNKDRWSSAEVNKGRRGEKGQGKSLQNQWHDPQVATVRHEQWRVQNSWSSVQNNWSSSTPSGYTPLSMDGEDDDCDDDGEDVVGERRLLDALALHKFSDLQPQYRPSF